MPLSIIFSYIRSAILILCPLLADDISVIHICKFMLYPAVIMFTTLMFEMFIIRESGTDMSVTL